MKKQDPNLFKPNTTDKLKLLERALCLDRDDYLNNIENVPMDDRSFTDSHKLKLLLFLVKHDMTVLSYPPATNSSNNLGFSSEFIQEHGTAIDLLTLHMAKYEPEVQKKAIKDLQDHKELLRPLLDKAMFSYLI